MLWWSSWAQSLISSPFSVSFILHTFLQVSELFWKQFLLHIVWTHMNLFSFTYPPASRLLSCVLIETPQCPLLASSVSYSSLQGHSPLPSPLPSQFPLQQKPSSSLQTNIHVMSLMWWLRCVALYMMFIYYDAPSTLCSTSANTATVWVITGDHGWPLCPFWSQICTLKVQLTALSLRIDMGIKLGTIGTHLLTPKPTIWKALKSQPSEALSCHRRWQL